MYVLIGGAAVTAILGHMVDTWVILAVVLVNAIMGFIQEGRAENAMAAIRQMLAPQASVLRAGQRTSVDAGDLVAGRHRFAGAGKPCCRRPAGAGQ